MTEIETGSYVESADEPRDVIETLLADWREERKEWAGKLEEESDPLERQRCAGRKKAMEYAIGWIESRLDEHEPIEILKELPNRLAMRSRDTIEFKVDSRMVRAKMTAMDEQLNEMVRLTREVRYDVVDEWGEEPDPDDWEWVNEEVKERLLNHWGYETEK